MYTADKSLLKKLCDFAITFEVTPPQSNNILEWWKNVMQELKETDIQFIYTAFKAAMRFELAEYFSVMLEMLEGRRQELMFA